jgi:hypothetical protein
VVYHLPSTSGFRVKHHFSISHFDISHFISFDVAVYLATAMRRLSRMAIASIPASEESLVFVFCRMGLEALYKKVEGLKEKVDEIERIMPNDVPLTTSCDPRG